MIVKQHRCGSDSGLEYANDLQWQSLALKHQFALLGTKFPTDYQTVGRYKGDPCDSWDIIDSGSGNAFFKALRHLAQKSNHPELEMIPWVLWGHSGGADWSIEMSKKYSERTIAVVAMRCGVSSLLADEIESKMLRLPILLAVGAKDGYAEECLDLPKKVFSRYRKAGALWVITSEADAGHETGDTRHLAIPYLDAILSLRLTKTSTKLRELEVNQGWLGNPTTHAIAPMGQYVGDPLEAAWLPNEETARKWQEYITPTGFWNQMRYRICSRKQLVSLLGAPHLTESCYPDKITPTRIPVAPTDVIATQVTPNETVLTWDFAPDLENGLPKFRIYRDNSLIRTLQGQEHDNDDKPEPLQVVMEFRDREATPNAIYTVSAFNTLGESVSQPAK
ncbi:hypothetical protein V2H45_21960 [Tumidithrix elongata RA019]|uniref:Fibronectin type-III domain-containing protein n=1 Tax=Tumidithrix elongata BACA0141 TaxID=2716417 RepID=A0AAW9PY18_9CYAN|nr:hypothetical protein [Tumidithrix elongata RA019]